MRRFSKKLEDIMSAVTFAEEGEFETAKGMTKKREKKVLLALSGSDINNRALNYAVSTCRRINAGLDILASPTDSVRLAAFSDELQRQGLKHKITFAEGCLKQAIIDYTDSERDILFVVIQSTEDVDSGCMKKTIKLSDAWHKLRCPLVVVTARAEA